ncbi:MAG: ComF family protein [Acidobacteria bacterium]|nr:ComF family protein [Acidobacteriota bacterium]
MALRASSEVEKVVLHQAIHRGLLNLGRESLHLVLPSLCIVCDEPLPLRRRIASCCLECWRRLPEIRTPVCRRCGRVWQIEQIEGHSCLDCDEKFPVDGVVSWGRYEGGLEKVLSAFKFRRHEFLAAPLAVLMRLALARRHRPAADFIVPVPMSRRRRRQRGYNQAEELAISLSGMTGIPMRTLLVKAAENRRQSTLPRKQRRRNVANIFVARKVPRNASILLVDDICTTGETLAACARALKRAGASRVSAVTVARA